MTGGLVRDGTTLERVRRECEAAPEVAFDTEAKVAQQGKGLNLYDKENYICGFSVKPRGGSAWYISMHHPDSFNFPSALATFWPVIRNKTLGHNSLSFDAIMVHRQYGGGRLPLPGGGRDTLTMMPLLNENLTGDSLHTGYALKGWCGRVFGKEAVQAEQGLFRYAAEHGFSPKSGIYRMPASAVAEYACADVELAERAADYLTPRFEKLGITDLVAEYNDYRRLLTEMELGGLHVDWDLCAEYHQEAVVQAERSRQDLCVLAKKEVNPGSPLQMMKLLNIPTTQKWAIKRKMAQGDPMAALLWTWRRWSKAASTFYRPFLEHRHGEVLHPAFRFVRTGRLSCYEPNFHATPHYSPEYKVKDVFVAPKGYDLVLCDWKAAEMRLCAHYSGDPDLLAVFAANGDPHQMAADELGIPRHIAKIINFGAAYGLGYKKLARDLGCSEKEAQQWLTRYHTRFRGPRSLYVNLASLAEMKGSIRMWDGRYRHFDRTRNFPRTASNSLLQGGVGGMARRAMLRLWKECPRFEQRLQLHDAILMYVPEWTSTNELQQVREIMEDFDFRLPMPVDIKRGKTWGSLKEVV